jgi:hypothetical protein
MLIKPAIIAFIALEFSNVFALYFFPGSHKANSVGVFSAWEQSKEYPNIHLFIKYLVNWVSGVKLIFLFLLLVILFWGSEKVQRLSLGALSITTLIFYWRLFPLIRKMDKNEQIAPKHYSTYLGIMIFLIVTLFIIAAFF